MAPTSLSVRPAVLPVVLSGVALTLTLALAPRMSEGQSPPQEPSAVEIENARRLFREGVELFQQQSFGLARDRFLRAFRIRPSPLVRFNLALASHNAGFYNESIDAYRHFLSEAPDAPDWAPRREAARREIAELERRRAWLRIDVTGDEVRAFRLDGTALSPSNLGTEMPVDPGAHHIEVEGSGGGMQQADGTLLEAQHERVALTLERSAAVQSVREGAGWQTHTQTFGRQGIARSGPGGHFVDWSLREPPAVSAVWERFPVTVAAQLSIGSMSGAAALSARYFPQPWFGLELVGGAFSLQSSSGIALLAHLRIPLRSPSRWAFGAFAGPLVSDLSLNLQCTVRDNCADQAQSRSEHTLGSWVALGASAEWRFTTHWSVRLLVGIQRLLNPASVRSLADHASYTCTQELTPSAVSTCTIYSGQGAPTLTQAFASIDLGFSI